MWIRKAMLVRDEGSLRILWLVLILVCMGATGCSRELEVFCDDTTTAFCNQCYSCGANDDDASRLCGLAVKTDLEGCKIILNRICISEEASTYTPELAQGCNQGLEALTCEALEKHNRAPEMCQHVF